MEEQDRALSRFLLDEECFNLISSPQACPEAEALCVPGRRQNDAHLSQGNSKLAKMRNVPLPAHPGTWLSSAGYVPQPQSWEEPFSPSLGQICTEHTQGAGKRVLATGEPPPTLSTGCSRAPGPWHFGQGTDGSWAASGLFPPVHSTLRITAE